MARQATELIAQILPWLLADTEALFGRLVRGPLREEIRAPLDEQRIIEFYSRV